MVNNSNYHVIIPAAGYGRRMGHLAYDCPKSLLELAGRKIIEHSLEILNERGFPSATLVVGYMRELFTKVLGPRYKNLCIEYVVSEAYATTEHGWSLFLTKDSWKRTQRPVVLMNSDIVYDPLMLDKVMAATNENVVLVDNSSTREEELVLGQDGIVAGFKRGVAKTASDYVGGLVGINKFSATFMDRLYNYMDDFFRDNGPKHKYERVFDNMIRETGAKLNYLSSDGLAWINVNNEEDYEIAHEIANTISKT